MAHSNEKKDDEGVDSDDRDGAQRDYEGEDPRLETRRREGPDEYAKKTEGERDDLCEESQGQRRVIPSGKRRGGGKAHRHHKLGRPEPENEGRRSRPVHREAGIEKKKEEAKPDSLPKSHQAEE